MNRMRKRLEYIDNAKAILIFMVVLGHILNAANPHYSIRPYTYTQAFITSFHMPAFFLITGLLFKNEKWKEQSWGTFLLSRVRSLLIPYLFFETLAIVYLHFVLHSVTLADGLLRMVTFRCNVGADWFLPAMFLANMFYFVTVKYSNRYLWPVVAAVCFFCTWFLPSGHWWQVLCRGLFGMSFDYYHKGKVYRRDEMSLMQNLTVSHNTLSQVIQKVYASNYLYPVGAN